MSVTLIAYAYAHFAVQASIHDFLSLGTLRLFPSLELALDYARVLIDEEWHLVYVVPFDADGYPDLKNALRVDEHGVLQGELTK